MSTCALPAAGRTPAASASRKGPDSRPVRRHNSRKQRTTLRIQGKQDLSDDDHEPPCHPIMGAWKVSYVSLLTDIPLYISQLAKPALPSLTRFTISRIYRSHLCLTLTIICFEGCFSRVYTPHTSTVVTLEAYLYLYHSFSSLARYLRVLQCTCAV